MKRRFRVDGRHGQDQPDRRRPPDLLVQQDRHADVHEHDQAVLRREVVEVASVQEQRIDDALLGAFETGERVPGDDVGLLEHPDELWRQNQRRRYGHRSQREHVGQSSAHRMPARVQQPPCRQEQDHDEPAGEMYREDADERQYRRRDAVPVSQGRSDQEERRHRHPVCRQVGHRGDAELDVGHRGERGRQRARGGRDARGAPLTGTRPEQIPGQHRRAGRKQPNRCRHRRQGVAGGGCSAGELTEHRREGVEHRRVVQRLVRLDIAKLTHVGGRGLAGVQDEAHGVGMPDGVPRAGDGLPVGETAIGRPHDQQSAEQHAGRHRHRRPAADRLGLSFGVAIAGQQQLKTGHQHAHCGQRGKRSPTVPGDSNRAERNDRQRHDAVRQCRADCDGDRPGQLRDTSDDHPRRDQQEQCDQRSEPEAHATSMAGRVSRLAKPRFVGTAWAFPGIRHRHNFAAQRKL